MRYTSTHRAETRERIVAAASRAIRERGLTEASVVHIMGRAGLTHGAFYHHFADRDALIAAAVPAATSRHVFPDDIDAESMLATYCSAAHVASPGAGCVLAALATEAVHHPAAPVRAAFAEGARGFLSHVARVLRAPDAANAGAGGTAARANAAVNVGDDALALASRMLGAVILARLVDDARLASRILAAARR